MHLQFPASWVSRIILLRTQEQHLTEQDESFEDLLTDLEDQQSVPSRKSRMKSTAYKRELERLKMQAQQKQDKTRRAKGTYYQGGQLKKPDAILAGCQGNC